MRDWLIVSLLLLIISGSSGYLLEKIVSLQTDMIVLQTDLGSTICAKIAADDISDSIDDNSHSH